MNKTYLAKLVEMAKGNDRTIREDAKDAGVNASTISRILNENSNYSPGIKVLRKLTSKEAAPRNGITFQDLCNVSDFPDNKDELVRTAIKSSTVTLMAASLIPTPFNFLLTGIGLPFGTAAYAINNVKNKSTFMDNIDKQYIQFKKEAPVEFDNMKNQLERYWKENELITRQAMGSIYTKLLQDEISFKIGKTDLLQSVFPVKGNNGDPFIKIKNDDDTIKQWIFKCITLINEDSEEKESLNKFILNSIQGLISSFIFLPLEENRKISLVVFNQKLYNHILNFKDKLSYHGDLSVVLIDFKDFKIKEECFLACLNKDTKMLLT